MINYFKRFVSNPGRFFSAFFLSILAAGFIVRWFSGIPGIEERIDAATLGILAGLAGAFLAKLGYDETRRDKKNPMNYRPDDFGGSL